MSSSPSDPLRAADNALWHALEERRDQIRAAGQSFSERQHDQFRQAHGRGSLLNMLCRDMERYSGSGDPYYLRPMALAIKYGLPTWEHILIRRGTPWEPYVTTPARRGARRCIDDATAYIPCL